jgi:hypothetical protein
MKKRFLFAMAFMLVVVCGMFATRAIMAAYCLELQSSDCVSDNTCAAHCTPECGDVVSKYAYNVDKCVSVASGYHDCTTNSEDKVWCYSRYDCTSSATVCPTDAGETKCQSTGSSTKVKVWKKFVGGSGCGS